MRALRWRKNLDEAVQQLIGKPGQHWGTLRWMPAVCSVCWKWLVQATAPALQQQRLKALTECHQRALRDLLQPWLATAVKDAAAQQRERGVRGA